MLVLSRTNEESIKVGDDIEVVVLDVKHGKVRLGIRAPAHVRILRSELEQQEPQDVAVVGSGE